MGKKQQRSAIGIVIDYTIRIPQFIDNYKQVRKQISIGSAQMAGKNLTEEDLATTKKSMWDEMQEKNPEATNFYETLPLPTDETNDFDITYSKYFYNKEHRLQFLQDWSYNMFSQGSVTNKVDINLINVAQSKLFDVILIDRIQHTRKVGNTFAFLARAGIFCKQVLFVSGDNEIEQLKKESHIIDVWNPFQDSKQIIVPGKFGEPTQLFLDWLQEQEKKVKK